MLTMQIVQVQRVLIWKQTNKLKVSKVICKISPFKNLEIFFIILGDVWLYDGIFFFNFFYSLIKIITCFLNFSQISDCENPVDCGSWTSVNDISEGEFVCRSLDSEGPITYSNWDVNPNDVILHEDFDCLDIFHMGSWNISPCTDLKPFICEKNKNKCR